MTEIAGNEVIATARLRHYYPIGCSARMFPAFWSFLVSQVISQVTGTNSTNKHAFWNHHMIGWQIIPNIFHLHRTSIDRTVI
jgi:hypothetical protein